MFGKVKALHIWSKFLKADLLTHIIFSSLIRLVLIGYGLYHDQKFQVPYTDIDYKVFTDAARHVVNRESPYNRLTYRYSPLIAYLLVPNVLLTPAFGKLLFCEADLIVAYIIYKLVYLSIAQWIDKVDALKVLALNESKGLKAKKGKKLIKHNAKVEIAGYWSHVAMLFWLYNPMTLAISTRGNSDSLACLLVILTLYCIHTNWNSYVVGLLHGLSIHFRLYPIIYSLLFYVYYSGYSKEDLLIKNKGRNKKGKSGERKKIRLFRLDFIRYLKPNITQMFLVLGTITSWGLLTGVFYHLYGYKYLYESLIYHLKRVDFKHNFSLYFYLQYLSAFIKLPTLTGTVWQPLLMNLPPLVLLIHFSVVYGTSKFSLNFGVLCQTIVFVIYNKVLTSQYFVWIMGLLPLCLWQIKFTKTSVFCMLAIWFLAQASWLLPAYLLEFHGENTFFHIWLQGVSLFCAHIGIFGRLIRNFMMAPVMEHYD
ncbi:hypothetical protein ABEB36_001948 [Hypothenemus hampei]|uniref:GPI alpha-1,4-mannosyltransferase I, catalytic subunit n=1 Tax=Hypothenemus hampei TaxID=57062 RepID=A0ABD1FJE2_HYPHA